MAKRKLIFAAALLLVGILAGRLAFGLVEYGSNNPPIGLGIADISLTAEAFCEALNNGDYDAIESMIGGYTSLNLSSPPDGEIDRRLYQCLTDSYSSRPAGTGTVRGMTAAQDIEVSYFSLSLASNDVRQLTQQQYDLLLESGRDNDDLYDDNGELLESVAMELYQESIDRIIDESENYIASEVFTLEMIYKDGRWDIQLTGDLVRILLGGVNVE